MHSIYMGGGYRAAGDATMSAPPGRPRTGTRQAPTSDVGLTAFGLAAPGDLLAQRNHFGTEAIQCSHQLRTLDLVTGRLFALCWKLPFGSRQTSTSDGSLNPFLLRTEISSMCVRDSFFQSCLVHHSSTDQSSNT